MEDNRMAVKINTQAQTISEGCDLPRTLATKRTQDREAARAYRARKKLRAVCYPTPKLVAVEVEGRAGYWRAIHSNGLVQTVYGSHAEAVRKVRVIVDKMNAFETWCRERPKKQRIKLL